MFSCFKTSNKVVSVVSHEIPSDTIYVAPRQVPPTAGTNNWVDTSMLTDRLSEIDQQMQQLNNTEPGGVYMVNVCELLRSANELKKDFRRSIPYNINAQIDAIDAVIANLQGKLAKCDAATQTDPLEFQTESMLTDRLSKITQQMQQLNETKPDGLSMADIFKLWHMSEELKNDFRRSIPHNINMHIDTIDAVITKLQGMLTRGDALTYTVSKSPLSLK